MQCRRVTLSPHGKQWTSEEENALKTLYADLDVTPDELRDAFHGRTINAITVKANKLGIYRIPLHEERLRKLLEETMI
jgi:hypothetical protein